MDTTTPAVAPGSFPTCAIPSSTFAPAVVGAVLGMFLESAATIEDIANQNNLTISQVIRCLQEQGAFLQGMLATLELRVRLIAARAEVVAIESLREIAHLGRDSEARRKAASKLLSHVKPPSPRRTARATNVAGSAASLVRPSPRNAAATDATPLPLHAEGVPVSSGGLAERSDATPR